MAVFTAAYSNYRFARLYKSQDTAAFQESHADFFMHCHGTFQRMVYDNMKVAVKKFVGLTEREPTIALAELSIYYGFKFRFCNIASSNEKGHVERSVEFVLRKVFSAPGCDQFETLEEANRFLQRGCMRLNSTEISNGTVTVAKNHYSVPDKLVGKKVQVRLYTDKLIIYHDEAIVARHTRDFGSGQWEIDIYHYLRTLKRKPDALHQSTALLQADTTIKNIYEQYYSRSPKGSNLLDNQHH